MFPSSKFVNVITSPVCSFEDVSYGVYVTSGRISIASEYGRDVYDNALEKIRQTQHRMTILPFLYWVRTQDILFDAMEYQRRCCETLFVIGDACLTSLSQRAQ